VVQLIVADVDPKLRRTDVARKYLSTVPLEVEMFSSTQSRDPFLRPTFPLSNRVRRQMWNLCWALFYRTSPRPFHAWRSFLLRCFGAKLGPNCHFYPRSRVWAPWNLVCEDGASLGDDAEIYNPSRVNLGSHAVVSQQAYICGATHDYNDAEFPFISFPMTLGAYSWVCARASVAPGVNLGEGSVLALASVATSDLEPWTVYAGAPARKVKERERHHSQEWAAFE
jgi:putative colanic acid biosynthesis acetyltransferase WcaF